MKLHTRNIVRLTQVVAFLFFIANSGFTAILHFCAMQASECCDLSDVSGHHSCSDEDEQTVVSGVSVQKSASCQKTTVVGGLADLQASHERKGKALDFALLTAFVPAVVVAAPAGDTPSLLSSFCSSDQTLPPSVEKYVLNQTFLI